MRTTGLLWLVGLTAAGGVLFAASRAAAGGADALPLKNAPSPPVPPEWERWAGARPEITGWPKGTILAVEGLDKVSREVRKQLLQLAEETQIPVDTIATVIAHESRWNPAALYQAKDNTERAAQGKPEFYAAGLVQLTRQANLPGFEAAAKVREVASWPAERQMAEVVGPLWRGQKNAAGAHPGKGLMLNFMPAHAGKSESYVLAEAGSATYDMNKGLDTDGDDKVTVGDVYRSAARKAAFAKGRRIMVDGQILEPAIAPSSSAPASSAASKPSAATSAAASTSAPAKPAATPGTKVTAGLAGGRLLEAVKAGAIEPPTWIEVPFAGVVVRVSADALRAPVEGKSLRLPVSWKETMEIAHRLNAIPLTADLSDAIWKAATVRLEPRPLGKWNTPEEQRESSRMQPTLDWCERFNASLDGQIGDRRGELAADVGKDWIFSPRLALRPGLGVTYGWRYTNGKAIQGLGPDTKIPAHDAAHYDYSQTMRLVQRAAVDGTDLLRVYEARGMPAAVLRLFSEAA